jgi:ketosteroid isomerase-like protein
MGYTIGPWEYKDDISDAKPNAFGNFITVWKKQADGSWKFAVDLGISNPEPTQAVVPWRLPHNYKKQTPKRGGLQVESERAALLDREREFSNAFATRGARGAFISYAAPEVRVFREGKFPFVGKDSAAAALPAGPNALTWEPAFADVSQSGDLGYSYGRYRLAGVDATKNTTHSGNYLRIWQKQNGTWKVLIDVANPLPEPKNN